MPRIRVISGSPPKVTEGRDGCRPVLPLLPRPSLLASLYSFDLLSLRLCKTRSLESKIVRVSRKTVVYYGSGGDVENRCPENETRVQETDGPSYSSAEVLPPVACHLRLHPAFPASLASLPALAVRIRAVSCVVSPRVVSPRVISRAASASAAVTAAPSLSLVRVTLRELLCHLAAIRRRSVYGVVESAMRGRSRGSGCSVLWPLLLLLLLVVVIVIVVVVIACLFLLHSGLFLRIAAAVRALTDRGAPHANGDEGEPQPPPAAAALP